MVGEECSVFVLGVETEGPGLGGRPPKSLSVDECTTEGHSRLESSPRRSGLSKV